MKTILERLPKVELHIHLDGSVRVSTVSELLKMDYKEVYRQMVCSETEKSLTDYLTKFELPIRVMQTKENLIRITKEVLEDLKKEHVIYVEMRFAPLFHTKLGLTQSEVVEAVLMGIKQTDGIICNLVLCCMRSDLLFQNINNFETVKVAEKYLGRGVVGLDLAGDESKYPTKAFQNLFLKVNEIGIPYTIHAGEASDYHSIEDALLCKSKRIGHGIAATQNELLMKKLREEKILLEVCIQSNVDTKVILEKKDHPVGKLYQNCLVSINTDNRTVSQTTLTKEYQDLIKFFGFHIEDLKKCNIHAIEGSFLSSADKEKLKTIIEEEYHDTTYRS